MTLLLCINLVFILLCNQIQQVKSKECIITCSGNYSKKWSDQMKQIVEQNNCEKIELEISSSKFALKVLPNDWIKSIKHIPVESITFSSCDFKRIESEALMDITGLKKLNFKKGEFSYFEKSFFTDLPELKEFALSEFPRPLHAEAKLFENVPRLTILQIQNCIFDGQFITNITGKAGTPSKLEIIDLRYNTIKKLTDFMFLNARVLHSLYLQSCQIEEVSMKAFWDVNINLIDLSNNALRTLDKDTFTYINHGELAELNLNENPWKCDCHLKWLQDLYASPMTVLITPEPRCDSSVKISEAVFNCPTTTEPNNNTDTIQIKCINAEDHYISEYSIKTEELLESVFIILTSNKTLSTVNIYTIDGDSKVKLYFNNVPIKFNLVYFESLQPDNLNCIGNIKHNFVLVENLTPNETYTFCVLLEKEIYVLPTSCFGLHMPPNWEDRSWITNENKVIIIASISTGLILCAIISVTIAYFIIKRYPRLIDGNKDVVILKRAKRALPHQHSAPTEYSEPKFFCNPQSGYMTPASPKYEKIHYNTQLMSSIYDGKSHSYIRPAFSENSSQYGNRLTCINEASEIETYASQPNMRNDEKIY